ncbi:MAG: hypothetical protein IKN64_01650 [Desulfovibrio sp.]|nr:hypothetical protein [Desulfovibrio sp.]
MLKEIFCRMLLCLVLLLPVPALAEPGEQVPQWTRDGQHNLTHEWIEHGGARLYWNSLLTPRQVRLMGMRFRDPADRPLLMIDEPPAKKPARSRSHRRTGRRGAAHATSAPQAKPKIQDKPEHTSAKLDVKNTPRAGQTGRLQASPSRTGSVRTGSAQTGSHQKGLAPLKPVPPVGVPLQ